MSTSPNPKTKPKLRASGEDARRNITVSVRLSTAEAAELDARRGKIQRGTYCRLALQSAVPPIIPAINIKAYTELARLASNLNQIVVLANCNMISPAPAQVQSLLADLRLALIGGMPTPAPEKGDEV